MEAMFKSGKAESFPNTDAFMASLFAVLLHPIAERLVV